MGFFSQKDSKKAPPQYINEWTVEKCSTCNGNKWVRKGKNYLLSHREDYDRPTWCATCDGKGEVKVKIKVENPEYAKYFEVRRDPIPIFKISEKNRLSLARVKWIAPWLGDTLIEWSAKGKSFTPRELFHLAPRGVPYSTVCGFIANLMEEKVLVKNIGKITYSFNYD